MFPSEVFAADNERIAYQRALRDDFSVVDIIQHEGTGRMLLMDLKHMNWFDDTIVNGGSIENAKKRMMKYAKDAKDMERIEYLRKDLSVGKRYISEYADDLERYIHGKPTNKYKENVLKKSVKKGVTPAALRAYANFLNNEYAKALNDQAKSIRETKK